MSFNSIMLAVTFSLFMYQNYLILNNSTTLLNKTINPNISIFKIIKAFFSINES